MRHDDLKNELLKDSKFSKEYFKNDPLFKIGRQIKEMRISRGLTQEGLAKKMNTKQPSIARIESGRGGEQTDGFLKKFADALGVKFNPSSFSEIKKLNNEISMLSNTKTTNNIFEKSVVSNNYFSSLFGFKSVDRNISTVSISREIICV
jgi:transcriptional regulator with XRE-family HTH domain